MGFLTDAFGANPQQQYKPTVQAPQIGGGQFQAYANDASAQMQQQAFADALQKQMQGNGPSVATQMLQNQGSKNAAAMNAQVAGARGINPGLALRTAQESNINANQAAAGTAAAARAQEELGATSAYGNEVNTLRGQALGTEQANQQAQLGADQLNTNLATGAANNNGAVAGGVIGGISGAGSSIAKNLAYGGVVRKMASGGAVLPLNVKEEESTGGDAIAGGLSKLNPGVSQDDGSGGGAGGAGLMALFAARGGQVPGRAPVPGDSPKNDLVPTMLSADEVVIPRSVAHYPGFLDHVEGLVKKMHGEAKGFAAVLAARKGQAHG